MRPSSATVTPVGIWSGKAWTNSASPMRSCSAMTRPSVLLLGDRIRQFVLGHVRAPVDVELLGALVELLLGVALRIDASVGALGPVAGVRAALRGLRVRRPLLVLELPVVALLLGDVLDRRERGAVCALLGVVLLVGA